MGAAVTITPDQAPASGSVTITPDAGQEKGFLDRMADDDADIPLTSHAAATAQGFGQIGRGVFQAIRAARDTFNPKPQPGENAITSTPIGRIVRGLFSSAKQATEVPSAIHDINQSPDPAGTYLKVAGDTAGQGAGQLIPAAVTDQVARNPGAVKQVATAPIRGAVRGAEAAINSRFKPIVKIMTPADDAAASPLKIPGRDFGLDKPAPPPPKPIQRGAIAQSFDPATSPSRTLPGQIPPERTSVPYGPEEMPPSKIPFGPQQQKLLPAAPTYPGAPFPETPDPDLLRSRPLAKGPQPAAPRPSDALGTIPVRRGSIAESMQTSAPSPKPITRGSLSQMMGDQLEKGLGASPPLKPNVPLRGQISATMKEAAPQLPEGHTAVDSTAIRSYKYDPQTQEFEAWPTSGDTAYRYGEVSPDAAKAFQDAPSKGKAFQQIKNSGTLVAKRVNGKWVPVKPASR